MFKVMVISNTQTIFEGQAESVILPGDEGEYEILDFHRPIISLLKRGNIVIDGVDFPVRKGVAKFSEEELVAFVEL